MAKHRQHRNPASPQFTFSSAAPAASGSGAVSTPSASRSADYAGHQQEYRIIKHDLIRVAILNALFLAAVLALYYTDRQHHYLEQWFASLLK